MSTIKLTQLLPIPDKSGDSNTLDGLDSTQFLRADADDVFTGNQLTINDNATLNFGLDQLVGFHRHPNDMVIDLYTPVNHLKITDGTSTSFDFDTTGLLHAKSVLEAPLIRVSDDTDTYMGTNGVFDDGDRVYSPNNPPAPNDVGLGNINDYPITHALEDTQTKYASAASAYAAYSTAKADILGGTPPDALDTLTELSVALQDNDNEIAAITATLANKSDKSHTHAYLPLSGGTCTGIVTHNSHVDIKVNKILRFWDTSATNGAELFCNGSHFYLDLNGGIGNFYIRDGSTTRYTFDDNGHFTASNDISAYSDIRLKTNIQSVTQAIDKIMSLNGVTYVRTDTGELLAGVIAQDVQKVLPEAVYQQEDGYLSVSYNALSALYIEAIKEQQRRIDKLTVQINELQLTR